MLPKTITLHPDAWGEIGRDRRSAYLRRANELGVALRVGDTGLTKSEFLLYISEKAEWLDPWEDALRRLLEMDDDDRQLELSG